MAQRVNIEVLNKAAVDVTVQNSNAINVEVPTAPRGLSAEFTANQTEIDQFETVDFSATNAGFEYYWEIEDTGGFIFKKGKSVSHQYRDLGEFDVALTQADLNQQASGIQIKRNFIKVNQVPFLLNQPFGLGATAAYSLRKLKSSATKAVRVREDGSNTETDIGFVAGELDETAISNHCGSANGFVTKWYDQSGNGNDALNLNNASGQPKIFDSTNGVVKESKSGKPALEFNNNQFLFKNSMNGALVEYYEVIRQNEGGADKQQILLSDKYTGNVSYFVGVAIKGNSRSVDRNVGAPTHSFLKSPNPSTRDDYYNALEDTLELVNIFNLENLSLGFNFGISGHINLELNGKKQEIIAYPSNRSSSNRSSIKTNIDNFYSIT